MEVGKRITMLREAKGYTVNKLATLSGISQSYLRDIELGNKQPTVEYLEYICYGLAISLVDFFSIEESQNKDIELLLLKLTPQQKEKLIGFLKSL